MSMSPFACVFPQRRVKNLEVIWDGGEHVDGDPMSGWSAASMLWDGWAAIGMRWNCGDDNTGIGSPNSSGYPVWFILPETIAQTVLDQLHAYLFRNPAAVAKVAAAKAAWEAGVKSHALAEAELAERRREVGDVSGELISDEQVEASNAG
jgi:hypothetical protein